MNNIFYKNDYFFVIYVCPPLRFTSLSSLPGLTMGSEVFGYIVSLLREDKFFKNELMCYFLEDDCAPLAPQKEGVFRNVLYKKVADFSHDDVLKCLDTMLNTKLEAAYIFGDGTVDKRYELSSDFYCLLRNQHPPPLSFKNRIPIKGYGDRTKKIKDKMDKLNVRIQAHHETHPANHQEERIDYILSSTRYILYDSNRKYFSFRDSKNKAMKYLQYGEACEFFTCRLFKHIVQTEDATTTRTKKWMLFIQHEELINDDNPLNKASYEDKDDNIVAVREILGERGAFWNALGRRPDKPTQLSRERWFLGKRFWGNNDVCRSIGEFLMSGVDVNFTRAGDKTALFTASYCGSSRCVVAILNSGAVINHKNEFNLCTALHAAVERGHVEVVRKLLQAGADVNIANEKGRTPLHYAFEKGLAIIKDMLLQAGADIAARDSTGKTPLEIVPGSMMSIN